MHIIATQIPGVGVTTLFGMGTVFFCLTIIFAILSASNRFIDKPAEKPCDPEPVSDAEEVEAGDMGMPAKEELHLDPSTAGQSPEVAAAIMVALRKHRMSKTRRMSDPVNEGGINPWKLTGRMRLMR